MTRKYTGDILIQIRDFRNQGMGYKLIADKLNLKRDVVRGICKTNGFESTATSSPRIKVNKIRTCTHCGVLFEKGLRLYCSTRCRDNFKRKNPNIKNCSFCKVSFTTADLGRRKYCSDECREKDYREKKINAIVENREYVDKMRIMHLKFIKELIDAHSGTITPLETYKGSHKPIKCLCLGCGLEMEKAARDYIGIRSAGCHRCKNGSRGERKIESWLIQNKIKYIRQYSFPDLQYQKSLYYDFAVFRDEELKLLIEFDGRQHSEEVSLYGGKSDLLKTQIRDSMKTDYANRNDIPLLRIDFKSQNFIDDILSKCLNALR